MLPYALYDTSGKFFTINFDEILTKNSKFRQSEAGNYRRSTVLDKSPIRSSRSPLPARWSESDYESFIMTHIFKGVVFKYRA